MVVHPKAPFSLRNQNSYFGGWPVLKDTAAEFSIAMAFPVEGWQESAAVIVTQKKSGELNATVHGAKNEQDAIDQALACLSLDVDDAKWEAVGENDAFIKDLQEKYDYLRPVLFHSPYEAAAGFVIGQRISIKQRQALQKKMAEELGEKFTVEGQDFFAFPAPQKLLELDEFPGLNVTKLERLRGVAQAALDGKLDRKKLLAMSTNQALTQLESLNGIGPFYASGILFRGAGVVDDVTDDGMTKYAIQQAYHLPNEPSQAEVIEIAKNWQPYRMWAEVLIHVWVRREVGLPKH